MIFGAKDYSMRIWLKPDPHGPAQADAVAGGRGHPRAERPAVAAGKVGAEPTRSPVEFTYTVTTQGRLQSTEEFENIIVRANPDGSKVRVKDIARVGWARDYSFSATRNGQPTIPIGIYLAPGANQLDTAQAVRAKMVELKKTLPGRPGVQDPLRHHALCGSLDRRGGQDPGRGHGAGVPGGVSVPQNWRGPR